MGEEATGGWSILSEGERCLRVGVRPGGATELDLPYAAQSYLARKHLRWCGVLVREVGSSAAQTQGAGEQGTHSEARGLHPQPRMATAKNWSYSLGTSAWCKR